MLLAFRFLSLRIVRFHFVLFCGFLSLSALTIAAGESINDAIEAHPQEKIFILESGVYPGPVFIGRNLELRGNGESIIRSSEGTTVRVDAVGAELRSLTVDGSGIRFDENDAAVLITADGVSVSDLVITNATFGILVQKASGVRIIGNLVRGNPDIPLGMRGDGIRIWETMNSIIMSNRMIDSRDMVVWYASSNEFSYNLSQGGRYGSHYMYSHYNRISHNRFISNVVGTFIMYSRYLQSEYNLYGGTGGPSGYGLGIKESGNLSFISNVFIDNTTGIYSDNAPYDDREENVFSYNLITLSQIGIQFHGQPKRNVFRNNTFTRNRNQFQVSGMASADEVEWEGNYYDDYRGYDLDGDGTGDLPYEYRKLMNDLTGKYPAIAFFDGTPVHYLINLVGEALPIMKPQRIMEDPHPRVVPFPMPIE